MSIHSNKGKVEIEGVESGILADLSMIIFALRKAEVSENSIKSAVENGLTTSKNEEIKNDKEARIIRILKKFGLEG
jgi:hypothetical protein